MASNREISRLFNLYAELLLLHNKNEALAKQLSGAAYRLRNISEDVLELKKSEQLKQFRADIILLLEEIKKTGTINELDELIQLTPAGLFEMMRIRGLGGKKLSLLWRLGRIDSVDTLLQACKKNELSQIPGFGAKTQQNIIEAIESDRSSRDRFHYAFVADAAIQLVDSLKKIFSTELLSLCGEVRRQATTVGCIEIITAEESTALNSKALQRLLVIQSSTNEETRGHTLDEIPVRIYHTSKQDFHKQLFIRTGNDGHVAKVLDKLSKQDFSSEEMIYKNASLPFILPEMREDVAEWTYAGKATDLITLEDIKGVVHNHSTWSDGVDSLEDFVKACGKRGYEYVVISDHSKNAHYAGGLKEDKLLKQLEEIDALNERPRSVKIFKSIECDILVSGELDYDIDILKRLDMVIISVHQLLKMDEEKATKRLIKAIEHPYTTVLGHMTGRQLLIRPGYPVDFKKVIDACAANKVVIEINANPYRLDMDWSQLPYAMEKGVMISIDPDAHSIAEIDNIRWGVAAARKGGLTKSMTWNSLPLKEIEKWLKNKKPG
jgi:DNA polymerase (family X)